MKYLVWTGICWLTVLVLAMLASSTSSHWTSDVDAAIMGILLGSGALIYLFGLLMLWLWDQLRPHR